MALTLIIYTIWIFLVVGLLKSPVGKNRTHAVISGVVGFVVVSIGLSAYDISGTNVIEFFDQFVKGFGGTIDSALGVLGYTTNLETVFFNAWYWVYYDNLQQFLIRNGAVSNYVDSYYANLFIVLVYFLFRTSISLLWSLISLAKLLIQNAFSDSSENNIKPQVDENEHTDWWRWLDSKTVLSSAAQVFWLFVVVLSFLPLSELILGSIEKLSHRDYSNEVLGFQQNLILVYWAGLVILAGEIANAAGTNSWKEIWPWRRRKLSNDDTPDDLSRLYDDYNNGFDELKPLSKKFLPKQKKENEGNSQPARRANGKANQFSGYLKIGALSKSDFDFISEIVKDTKNIGGVTLIICPQTEVLLEQQNNESSKDNIKKQIIANIRNSIGSTLFELTHNVGYLEKGIQAVPGVDYDLVVGSEFELAEALNGEISDIEKTALEKVRSIVFVEFHRLDAGVISLQLERLNWFSVKRNQTGVENVFCQSDERQGLETMLTNMFGEVGQFIPNRQISNTPQRRFWFFWRADNQLISKVHSDAGLIDNKIVLREALPLLIIKTWARNLNAAIYDPEGKVLLRGWQTSFATAMQNSTKEEFKKYEQNISNAKPFSLFQSDAIEQVVFQEDFANVLDAVKRYKNFIHDGDTMIHIVSCWYPMLEFMRDSIDTSKGDSTDIVYDNTLLPIQPLTGRGVKQVAIELYEELSQAGKLLESDVSAILNTRSNQTTRNMLRDLGVTTTKRGIELLFIRALGLDIEVARELLKDKRDASYSLAKTAASSLYQAPMIWENSGRQQTVSHIFTGDYGLTYVRGSQLQIGRQLFKVSDVNYIQDPIYVEQSVIVGAQSVGESGRKIEKYCRNYKLIPEMGRLLEWDGGKTMPYPDGINKLPAILIEEREDVTTPVPIKRRLLHLSFERQTFGHYRHEQHAPFALKDRLPEYIPAQIRNKSQDDSEGIRMTRILQPAFILSIGGKDSKNNAIGKIAFTLAATLSDLIHSLFPKEAKRIAVISPQASVLFPNLRKVNAVLTPNGKKIITHGNPRAYAELIYPHFIQEAEKTNARDWAHKYGDIFGDGMCKPTETDNLTRNLELPIDFLILEDASLDLGVARSLYKSWNNGIDKLWVDYLTWLTTAEIERNPYAFGTDKVSEQFDFEGSLKWLKP